MYGRLSTKDVIKRFKLHYGEDLVSEKIKGNTKCESCHYPNASDAIICMRCSSPINTKEKVENSTGLFKEILKQKEEFEKKSEGLKDQRDAMTEMDLRLKAMDEALRAQRAEIDAKMTLLQSQTKEVAFREIQIELASRP